MFNQWIGIGRLTRDVELRYTPQGTPVASFDIAVNHRYKDQDETLFMSCVSFGKQAETCGKYLNKGSLVMVIGRLKEEKWESKGEKKSKTKVIVNTVKFLNSKGNGNREQAQDVSGEVPEEQTDLEPF